MNKGKDQEISQERIMYLPKEGVSEKLHTIELDDNDKLIVSLDTDDMIWGCARDVEEPVGKRYSPLLKGLPGGPFVEYQTSYHDFREWVEDNFAVAINWMRDNLESHLYDYIMGISRKDNHLNRKISYLREIALDIFPEYDVSFIKSHHSFRVCVINLLYLYPKANGRGQLPPVEWKGKKPRRVPRAGGNTIIEVELGSVQRSLLNAKNKSRKEKEGISEKSDLTGNGVGRDTSHETETGSEDGKRNNGMGVGEPSSVEDSGTPDEKGSPNVDDST